jgi:hypothetical protein
MAGFGFDLKTDSNQGIKIPAGQGGVPTEIRF